MEKINIAELLKDCPKGMELDCASYDNVSFDKISDDKKAIYPIFCYITDKEGNRSSISFTENGCESKRYGAKCVIFPKGKTTWEGFVPPCKFKDGDVLTTNLGSIFILKEYPSDDFAYHCYIALNDVSRFINYEKKFACKKGCRFATEEEKQKLFDAIKANGYCWNDETKTLEKLIESKFKVGDKIKKNKDYISGIITNISDDGFYKVEYLGARGGVSYINIASQDDWELVPDKFDVTKLKPFDKVLVRSDNKHRWSIQFFERLNNKLKDSFVCMGGWRYRQCIPFEGNEHLLDTANECNKFFKVWEE